MVDTNIVAAVSSRASAFRRRIPGLTGLVVVAVVVLVVIVTSAALAPIIAPYDPNVQNLPNANAAPSSSHLLGTDSFGRDILSRLLYAGRTSLSAALLAVGVGGAIGIVSGLVAGYVGGVVDSLMSRWVDVMLSLPGLIFVFAVIGIIGPGLTGAMITFGVLMSPTFYRVVRSSAADFRHRTFVTAARSVGCRQGRILRVHILPNALSPMIVQLTLGMGMAIVGESSLSFLGLGAQTPQSSWGSMVQQAYDNIYVNSWELVPPATILIVTILCLSIVGDTITDSIARRGGQR